MDVKAAALPDSTPRGVEDDAKRRGGTLPRLLRLMRCRTRETARKTGLRARAGTGVAPGQTESRHNKTKSHQRKTGANPCEEGPLCSERIAQVGSLTHLFWCVHVIVPF